MKNCIICQDEIPEASNNETCPKKECRLKHHWKKSKVVQRKNGWVKMRSRLNDRHRAIMKRAGIPGPYKVGDYLKASTRQLKVHIQNQFRLGMNWENYGFDRKDEAGNIIQRGWVIDHIVPCILFDLTQESHLLALWSLENLRPEFHLTNLVKHGRVLLAQTPQSLRERVEALGIQLTEPQVPASSSDDHNQAGARGRCQPA